MIPRLTRSLFRYTNIALLILAPALFLFACSSNDSVYTGHFTAFGSRVDITIVGMRTKQAQAAIEAVAEDFAYMEKAWTPRGRGALARTNALLTTGNTFSAPPSILPLLQRARDLENTTGGLLNSAQGKVRALWEFEDEPGVAFVPPDEAVIDQLLDQQPSVSDIENEDFRLRTNNSAVMLDFDGFLKGYIIDQAIFRLLEYRVDDAMVNVAGDIRAIGSRAGHPWNVPVRRSDGTGVLATLDIQGDESVITVGEFETYRDHAGTRYHPILDPRTGHPAVGLKSVTVVHRDATTAHAGATALFIAGLESWSDIAANLGLNQIILIADDETMHVSPDLQRRLRIQGKGPNAQPLLASEGAR